MRRRSATSPVTDVSHAPAPALVEPELRVSSGRVLCVERHMGTCEWTLRHVDLLHVSYEPEVKHPQGRSPPALPEGPSMKTPMSRFQIHDDLTAPEGSVPVLRGALATGGQLPNFLGVLAGAPAALRGYARFRSELRRGKLTMPPLARISLAVAEHSGSAPGVALHSRTARSSGLGLDEVAAAREFGS